MDTSINAEELEFVPTAHGAGLKKVLIQASDTPTMLCQFAYGILMPGDKIPEHLHSSMEEIFYFLKGEGIYTVNDTEFKVLPSTVVRIPSGVTHSLETSGVSSLEFLYFGIATA